jgi:hypothetical protein
MNRHSRFLIAVVACAAMTPAVSRAAATVKAPTVSSGGRWSSSATFWILSTIAEPIAGGATGGSLRINAGYIPCISALEVSAAPEPAPPGGLTRFQRIGPNPFRSRTSIAFEVAGPAETTIRIYDVMGRLTRTLVDARLDPGTYTVDWDGQTSEGLQVGTGVYYCQLHSGDVRLTHKITFIR